MADTAENQQITGWELNFKEKNPGAVARSLKRYLNSFLEGSVVELINNGQGLRVIGSSREIIERGLYACLHGRVVTNFEPL